MDIIDFYKDVLVALTATVNEQGEVLRPDGTPFEVLKKKLVLPTRDRLKENDWSTTQPFHPMCEDAVMGQSEVIHWIAKTMKAAMVISISHIMAVCLEAAIKPELQEQAKDPKLVEILGNCKGTKPATVSTLQAWMNLRKKFAGDVELLNIALNRGGVINGEKHHRVCKVHFPLLDDTDNDGLLCGVKMSKNDKQVIQNLLRYVLDGVTLVYGSNDSVPYFHSLMSVYASFLKRQNFFAKVLKRISDLKPVDLDWVVELNDLRQFLNKIPRLAGNEGNPSRTKKQEVSVANPAAEIPSIYDKVKVEGRVREEVAANDSDKAPWDETPKEVSVSTTKPAVAGAIKLSDLVVNRKPTFEELRTGERPIDRFLPRGRDTRYDDRYSSRRDDYYDDRRDHRDDRRDYRNDRRDDHYADRPAPRGNNLSLADLTPRRR